MGKKEADKIIKMLLENQQGIHGVYEILELEETDKKKGVKTDG